MAVLVSSCTYITSASQSAADLPREGFMIQLHNVAVRHPSFGVFILSLSLSLSLSLVHNSSSQFSQNSNLPFCTYINLAHYAST